MKNYRILIFALLIGVGLSSCTVSPTAKQYCVESDFFNGEMTVHQGPGVKDYSNFLDAVTYYDKVDGYSFSANDDEGGSPINIRFANNNIGYLSGHTDYRLPEGEKSDLMMDIEENYGSSEAVEQQLIRNALEKAAFNAGQFMDVFDALGKNRSYLQELIFDQANFGQYQVKWDEVKQTDIATGKEVTVKVSDRIECDGGKLCINGYLRTEESALELYGIQLFNFTVKSLRGEPKVEQAIAANLERSNRMEELAIEAREAQVNAATIAENAKASVAEKIAEKDIAVAEAQKSTAVAEENLKQKKFAADAKFYEMEKEAAADRLKVQAGLTPMEKATIDKETAIGIAEHLSKRPVPMIVNNGAGGGQLENSYAMKEMILLLNQLQNKGK